MVLLQSQSSFQLESNVMANITEAIENVRSLSRTFQSVIDLASALEGMNSIEQALNEKKLLSTKLEDDIKKKKDIVYTLDLEISKGDEELETIKQDSETEAQSIITEARQEAKKIKDEASKLAHETLAKSKTDLKNVTDSIISIENKKQALENEYNDIEAKLARAKAKMAEMLGG